MCSPDIPDTTAAQMDSIAASERIANRQFELQKEAMDYFKQRQVGIDATADKVTASQLAQAEETAAQGRDIFNYQKEVFRPVEQNLVAEAMRESTPEYYEQYAQQAMAAHAAAQANAQGQAERNMASMGVNPNSGAWASTARGLQISNAATLGGVANDSRDRAEALGWAKKAEVAGLGKGLVGAGNASYGLATGASTAAAAAGTNAATTAANTMGSPTQYGGLAVQGANNVTNAHNDIYRTQVSAGGKDSGSGLATVAGTALGYWASSGFAT